MERVTLRDGESSFDATVVEPPKASRTVLFAVGGGGNPERHLPLLEALAGVGCTVVAPHFERLVSPSPSGSELLLRARRLKIALGAVARPALPSAGVGHSIGTTMLLALAGGQAWMRTGQRLHLPRDERLERLALLAPATGFFQAPNALDLVTNPILAWAGLADVITPPSQAAFLETALRGRVALDLRVAKDAGHFTFMHRPPPQRDEPHPNREAFLSEMTSQLCQFVLGWPNG